MTAVDAGVVERFRALFEANWDAVERYARRRVGPDSAADVAAEVFAIAWRRMDAVPADPVPWLYGVARRVVANHRRSAQRADRLVDRLGAALLADDKKIVWAVDPAQAATTAVALAAAFDRLPEPDQEVLALVVWEDLDARRAAAALGCGIGALTMQVTRARRRLRALLAEEAD